MRGYPIEISVMLENELVKNMEEVSVKDFLSKSFERKMIDDKHSSIYEVFFVLSPLSFPLAMVPF